MEDRNFTHLMMATPHMGTVLLKIGDEVIVSGENKPLTVLSIREEKDTFTVRFSYNHRTTVSYAAEGLAKRVKKVCAPERVLGEDPNGAFVRYKNDDF